VVPLSVSQPAIAATSQRELPHRRYPWISLAVAASLAVAIGIAFWVWSMSDSRTYNTDTGQQQKIKLADGSLIDLNTESRVKTELSTQSRDVYLLSGEALFEVHHDARRPFRVHVGAAVIQDIGTRFNVYRHSDSIRVSVIEGEVEITGPSDSVSGPVHLTAGQEANMGSGGVLRQAKANIAQATAWQQRRLWFQGATLDEMVVEFNRYNSAPKIRVADEVLRGRRFSGIFNADDPKSFVEFLYQDAGMEFDYDKQGFVIRAR